MLLWLVLALLLPAATIAFAPPSSVTFPFHCDAGEWCYQSSQTKQQKVTRGRPNLSLLHHHRHNKKHPERHQRNQERKDGFVNNSSATKKSNTTKNHSNSNSNDAALHQIEHRAKEKGAFGVAHRLAEQLERVGVVRAERRVGERALEHAAERGVVERGAERAVEKLVGGGGGGERAIRLKQSAKQAAERVTERALERTGETTVERSMEVLAERSAQKAAERALERTGEATAERISKQAAKKSVEHSLERSGEHVAEELVERLVEQSSKSTLLQRSGERAVEHVLEQSSERAVEQTGRRLLGISTERIAARIGRGLAIALPIAGGVFAFYLFRSDYHRLREELMAQHDTRTLWSRQRRRRVPSLALLLFGGAGVADFLDAILHFVIAFAFITSAAAASHGGHSHIMVVAEEWSMGCAVVSTVAAVLGEIASRRSRQTKQEQSMNSRLEQSQEL